VKLVSHHIVIPRDGCAESGDAALVRTEDGVSLIAVVDALGHGPHAAEVANIAVAKLQQAPVREGVRPIMEQLHAALRGTRGAAATVILSDGLSVEGCGVGNVEVFAVGARVPVVLTPGILGSRVQSFKTFEAKIPLGVRLVFHSDGITSAVARSDLRALSAKSICESLMAKYRRPHDDATVLVADLGEFLVMGA
jgi:negative regulator of sigma-B (phosphoserine phosphatase)